MVKRGHRVTLVDRSERMLASAREKKAALTPEEQSRFAIEKADLATLERSDTFPCIFAVGCPTTFLESEGEILRFLRKVHGWLEPGGYFYLDFFSLRHWEAFPGWKAAKWQPWFEKQTTKGPVRAWVKTYSEAEADRVVFEYSMSTRRWPIRFFHDLDRVCLFPEAKWREFLSSSGFTVHKQFGIWEHESYPDELPIGNDINLITLKAQRAS